MTKVFMASTVIALMTLLLVGCSGEEDAAPPAGATAPQVTGDAGTQAPPNRTPPAGGTSPTTGQTQNQPPQDGSGG